MCERISGSGDLVPKLTLKHQSTGELRVTNALPPLDASTLKCGGGTRMLRGAVHTMNTTTSVTSEPSGMSTPPLALLVTFFFFFYRCKKSNIFVYLNFYIEIVVQT